MITDNNWALFHVFNGHLYFSIKKFFNQFVQVLLFQLPTSLCFPASLCLLMIPSLLEMACYEQQFSPHILSFSSNMPAWNSVLTYAELSFSYLDYHSHGGFLAGLWAHRSQNSTLLMFLSLSAVCSRNSIPLLKGQVTKRMSNNRGCHCLAMSLWAVLQCSAAVEWKERGSCSVVTCWHFFLIRKNTDTCYVEWWDP